MLYALFDPGTFLLSDADWNCSGKRIAFLDRLNKHLEFIQDVGVVSVVWCDELGARLWSHPQMPPWKKNRNLNYSMTVILYQFLTKHACKFDIAAHTPADICPALVCCCSDALGIFRQLASTVIQTAVTPYFCPSLANVVEDDHQFRDDPTSEWVTFPVVRHPSSWSEAICPSDLFWPTNRKDCDRFIKCIEYTALAKKIPPKKLRRYRLSQRFMGDILSASKQKRLVEMIVRRLSMSLQEASADPQLRDELISEVERRFRVTPRPSSLRIHYQFKEDCIVFTRFYDKGRHDDGL